MGNNNLHIKMFASSVLWLLVAYLISNVFRTNDIVVGVLMGSALIYGAISGIYFSYDWYTPRMFADLDKKFFTKYNEKLVLSRNDKIILKEICYKVVNKRFHGSMLTAIKEQNKHEIERLLSRNKWKIDNRTLFDNVIALLSEQQ